MKVSVATIRRDLEILEEEGKVRRVHGGAVSTESRLEEAVFENKKVVAQTKDLQANFIQLTKKNEMLQKALTDNRSTQATLGEVLLDLENKKSPEIFDLFVVFLIYPSISAPSSVLRLFSNSISPFTTPELPIITF